MMMKTRQILARPIPPGSVLSVCGDDESSGQIDPSWIDAASRYSTAGLFDVC
jgi:hypothetical protein